MVAKEWSEEVKAKTKNLFREYVHIFALESLDMGHTSMVKHKIKLDNYTLSRKDIGIFPLTFLMK